MNLEVIPQARQVTLTGQGFAPDSSMAIRVSDTAPDRFAAMLLAKALQETHGIDCPVFLLPWTRGEKHKLRLSGQESSAPSPALPTEDRNEGYGLTVAGSGARIGAETEAGLYYGIQTLIQLAEQSMRDGPIPGMTVVDWPAFGVRIRYIEGGQSKGSVVVTRAALERTIRRMGRFKLNCLIVEVYNLAPFESFPYCADANTLSRSDWEFLVEFAHAHHVVIVPSLQSFAQMYDVLNTCPEGEPYSESTAPGLICPSRKENIEFLQGLYKDLLALFKHTPFLGIGCSEVGMQWKERYCPRCRARLDAGETLHDIYSKHVNNCIQAVDAAAAELARQVRPIMWADEFYMGYDNRRWEGIENIPKHVVMGHWQYWSTYQNMPDYDRHDYDGISGLLARGYDTLFLSASFEFNTYLHDLSPDEPMDGKWYALADSGIHNIADQAGWAFAHAREGHPGKVLGGGCATFSQHDIRCWDTTWYAYLLQAEYSWGDPTRPLADEKERFTDTFAAAFYGATERSAAGAIADAWRQLDAAKSDIERNNYVIRDIIGEYDIHDTSYPGNDLVDSLKLIRQLQTSPQAPGREARDVRIRAEHVRDVAKSHRAKLASVMPQVRNRESLRFLIMAAGKIENHAVRTLYMLDQEEALARLAEMGSAADRTGIRQDLDRLGARLTALQADTRLITDHVDRLTWGRQAGSHGVLGSEAPSSDTTGYHRVLASLAAFRVRLDEAREALDADSAK